jgi:hypothetical protein
VAQPHHRVERTEKHYHREQA